MSYPRVQFVSSPSLDADVRFDCNSVGEWSDDDRWPEHDGFTLGFPSLGGDPEAIGVQYGTRSIEFNLIVRATPDAAFNAFSRLSREVQRPRNWLMVQFSDFSLPVWFYTYRTEQQALDFENVSGIDDAKRNVWGIGVRLAADPFAQGERITLPTVPVPNDPFASGGCIVRLPDVIGDSPAPVRMQLQTSKEWTGHRPLVSTIALEGGPYDGAPIAVAASTLVANADAGAVVAAADRPGGGYRPVPFTTNGLSSRVSDASTVLPIGTWRALVWVDRDTVDSTFRLRARRTVGGVSRPGDTVDFDRAASATGNLGTWIDLGLITVPDAASMDDQTATYASPINLAVDAQRLSGTGNLNFAALLYVPAETPWSVEERTGAFEFGFSGLQTTQTAEWDEDGNYRAFLTSSLSTRRLVESATPKPTGGMPLLVPGCTNTLTVLQQTNPHTPANPADDNRDVISATTTVGISYAPRYLHLAGSEQL